MRRFLPNSRTCFVCGTENPIGMRVRFRVEGDGVMTEFIPSEAHMGYVGIVHGGVLATLLDETMGWAPSIITHRFCMAVELQIRYVRSAPIGRKLIIRSRATRTEGRLWEAKGEVVDEEGTVYVKGAGKFYPLSNEETDRVRGYLLYDEETLED